MKKYRVTKYNPFFRNENDHYLVNDWTSVSDIGRTFYDGVLTKEKYLITENKYISVVRYMLESYDVKLMLVLKLENYIGNNEQAELLSSEEKQLLKNIEGGELIGQDAIISICKMILREIIWAELISDDMKLKIEFGYDYYMYVFCDDINEETKNKISEAGLYLEELQYIK